MDARFTLLTGASSTLGRAIAAALAPRHMILSGRSGERLQESKNADDLVWQEDLSDVEATGQSLTAFLAAGDVRVDHFVHCAGVFDMRPLHTVEWNSIEAMFAVNLFSAIEIVRQLSRKRVNGGELRSVTFISSIATRIGTAGYHTYAATKGALNALARSLAVELAPAVRVNCILPGPIEVSTPRAVFSDKETAARLAKTIPLGLGKPKDVAGVVAFLVSDQARWITGQEIVVDGGRSVV